MSSSPRLLGAAGTALRNLSPRTVNSQGGVSSQGRVAALAAKFGNASPHKSPSTKKFPSTPLQSRIASLNLNLVAQAGKKPEKPQSSRIPKFQSSPFVLSINAVRQIASTHGPLSRFKNFFSRPPSKMVNQIDSLQERIKNILLRKYEPTEEDLIQIKCEFNELKASYQGRKSNPFDFLNQSMSDLQFHLTLFPPKPLVESSTVSHSRSSS